MGLLIQLIINPPVAWLNEALYGLLARLGTGSRVLLGVLLGGMMSVDMGAQSIRRRMYSVRHPLRVMNFRLWRRLWQAVWCRRWRWHWQYLPFGINSAKRSGSPAWQT